MKYSILVKKSLFVSVLFVLACAFVACDESIKMEGEDESRYTTAKDVLGYIIDENGMREFASVSFRREGHSNMYIGLSREAPQDASFALTYDPALLQAYNEANKSDYVAFPQKSITLPENISITKGSKKSDKAKVTFVTNEKIDAGKAYVIPLRVEVKSGSVKLSEDGMKFLLFVKDHTKLPDTKKSTEIEIISCMEVNDTNPLNNLCFTLKNSGKYLIDMVILFSANINYNSETGKVYVSNNPNVQHLLSNREKYLQPLQDAGMKVVLGVLGNHDRSGIANLSDETARAFAQELKTVCETYKLDGVFFDDEYSKPQSPPPPGFVTPSEAAAARLCYETKKAMPDKLVTVYVYSHTRSLPDIDGKTSGQFVDYGIHDYGGSSDLSNNYPGMPKKRMALYSQEFNRKYYASESALTQMRRDGYGAHMIFAMDPTRWDFSYGGQQSALEKIAKNLFDDELVYNGQPYAKDY